MKGMLNQIEIPFKLKVNSGAESDLQAARQKIEKTALLIGSVFNLIQVSQTAAEEQQFSTSKKDQLLNDIQHVCEIGAALTSSLFEATMPILAAERQQAEGALKILKNNHGGYRIVKNN